MPIPTQNMYQYQVYTSLQGTDQETSTEIFLLPPKYQHNSSIIFQVGGVYMESATDTVYSNGDFDLTWTGTANPKIAQITIKNNNAWKCAATARRQLQQNFIDFINRLENMVEGKSLIQGGSFIIAQRIAEVIPATFKESLFYRYGLNDGFSESSGVTLPPYVDLQPGMRLKLCISTNQFVAPSSNLNGLAGTGETCLNITEVKDRNGVRKLAFDAFLGMVSPPTVVAQIDNTAPVIADGLIGLQSSGSAHSYYRLVYPQHINPSSMAGDLRPAYNPAIIGADTLEELTNATVMYSGGTWLPPQGSSVKCFIFRGRAAIIPEILVWMNDRPVYVPVGTTVRGAVARLFTANPYDWERQTGGVNLTVDRVQSSSLINLSRLNFRPVSGSFTDDSIYDVPLVKGDRITMAQLGMTPVVFVIDTSAAPIGATETVNICGSACGIGSWNSDKAVGPGTVIYDNIYTVTVYLPAGERIEFKVLKKSSSGMKWDNVSGNRVYNVPLTGVGSVMAKCMAWV